MRAHWLDCTKIPGINGLSDMFLLTSAYLATVLSLITGESLPCKPH